MTEVGLRGDLQKINRNKKIGAKLRPPYPRGSPFSPLVSTKRKATLRVSRWYTHVSNASVGGVGASRSSGCAGGGEEPGAGEFASEDTTPYRRPVTSNAAATAAPSARL